MVSGFFKKTAIAALAVLVLVHAPNVHGWTVEDSELDARYDDSIYGGGQMNHQRWYDDGDELLYRRHDPQLAALYRRNTHNQYRQRAVADQGASLPYALVARNNGLPTNLGACEARLRNIRDGIAALKRSAASLQRQLDADVAADQKKSTPTTRAKVKIAQADLQKNANGQSQQALELTQMMRYCQGVWRNVHGNETPYPTWLN